MSVFSRKEDDADKWLRDHDPYYTSKAKNKSKLVANPYDTPEQEHRKSQMELPLSSLSVKQVLEIGGQISDDGNIEL